MSESKPELVGEGSCEPGNDNAGAAAPELPPITNRGVTVTVDYLRITFHTNVRTVAELLLKEVYGYEIEEEDSWSEHFQMVEKSIYCYKVRYYHEEKVVIYAYPYDESKHCCVELSGQALARIDFSKLQEMLRLIGGSGIRTKCTRIDVAFDHNLFKPVTCFKAYKKGCYRTQARRGKRLWLDGEDGNTFYVGSRQSGRFLRVYDKRGFTRTEMEFKERYAEHLGAMLQNLDGLFRDALGFLRSFIEYTREPVDGKNSSRVEVVAWWMKLVGSADKLRLEPKEGSEDFLRQRQQRYFERLLPTLSVFYFGLGIDLNKAAMRRCPSLGVRHSRLINELRDPLDKKFCND